MHIYLLAFTVLYLITKDTSCFTEMPYALSIKGFTFAVHKNLNFTLMAINQRGMLGDLHLAAELVSLCCRGSQLFCSANYYSN